MAVNSHDVKAVVSDQCFFMDFDCVCGDAGDYPVTHFSVHGKHNGANFKSARHSICKLHPF